MRSVRRAPVSPAEFRILEALWALGAGTVAAVHAALPRGSRTSYNTVLTQVRHLHARGCVTREAVGRAHVYRPRQGRAEVLERVVTRVADDYFGGRRGDLADVARRDLT